MPWKQTSTVLGPGWNKINVIW